MRQRLATVRQELAQASLVLDEPRIDHRSIRLEFVDVLLNIASRRLQVVDEAVARYGPSAAVLATLPTDVPGTPDGEVS